MPTPPADKRADPLDIDLSGFEPTLPIKPKVEQAAMSNCIEREQAERAECRIAAAKSHHQKQPASGSKIKLADRVRNKIKKGDNKTPRNIYD